MGHSFYFFSRQIVKSLAGYDDIQKYAARFFVVRDLRLPIDCRWCHYGLQRLLQTSIFYS